MFLGKRVFENLGKGREKLRARFSNPEERLAQGGHPKKWESWQITKTKRSVKKETAARNKKRFPVFAALFIETDKTYLVKTEIISFPLLYVKGVIALAYGIIMSVPPEKPRHP